MFFLISGLLMGIAWGYSTVRILWPARLSCAVRLALILFLLVCAEKMILLRFFSSSLQGEGFPRVLVLSAGMGQVLVIILFLLALIWDMVALACTLCTRGQQKKATILQCHKPTIVFCVALLVTGYGAWSALKSPVVQDITFPIHTRAPQLEEMLIVQLSDLHMGSGFSVHWVREVVQTVNALHPDLIVITGDLVDGSPEDLKPYCAALQALQAPLGVYVVPGNHEYYSGIAQWVETFEKMGFHVLMNRHALLSFSGAPIVLAGVSDPGAQRFGAALPDVRQAMRGAPQDALRILLAHQPVSAQGVDAASAPDVQLSGHTHGGTSFFLQDLIAFLNKGYVAGVYTLDTHVLYVHRGTGIWGGFPLRLGVPSEITRIRFAPR